MEFRKNKSLNIAAYFFPLFLVLLSVLPGNDSLLAIGTDPDSAYFPEKGIWEKRKPEVLGMDSQLLQEAIDFAVASEWNGPTDLEKAVTQAFAVEPYGGVLGPTKERGNSNGIIVKNGYIVAEWGETIRVDMTFSVSKSFLSTTVGLALDSGLIADVHDPVRNYVVDGKFDSEHNAKITWHHLLNQTSDWSGTLWDRPDWGDRPRRDATLDEMKQRKLNEPGTHFKYNDVRVNLLAYSLLQLWRIPLPVVLREKIMDPIGASPTWRWHGYENSWVPVDGLKMQSVSGGGHWGGGMFISTRDQARFGLLFLRNGNWKGRQLISKDWIKMLRVPTPANPSYGYMWWLNTERQSFSSAPESVFYAAGFGGNYIVVDQEHDLVIAVRWAGSSRTMDGIIQRVLAALHGTPLVSFFTQETNFSLRN